MYVIFCSLPSFITIKYNCALAKLTPYKVHILFTKLLKFYIFSYRALCITAQLYINSLGVSFILHWMVVKWSRKVTLSGLCIIQSLNKHIVIAVISYSNSFFISSSLCATAVNLENSALGFRVIYFPSFITTVLHRLSIGWTFDLDLVFASCRKIASNPSGRLF